jgi:cysteine synthase A
MRKVESALDLIGSTPVLKIRRLTMKEDATIWAKLECFNPGGSVKDRICRSMIEAAEKEGKIHKGSTIVEPTSGNTGISLALVCAVKGYRLILTMPETMSAERQALLAAYGAQLELTPGKEGMRGAIRRAEEMAIKNEGFFMPQQFKNPANPQAHREATAQEILSQFKGKLDAFVAGVGTGGTITGVGEVLKKRLSQVKIVAVEPAGSSVLSGENPGPHRIQGIGAGFVPDVLNTEVIDQIIPVRDEEAAGMVRRLAKEEGILVGVSSGAAACGALRVARELGKGKTVVVILPDAGERYLGTGLFTTPGVDEKGRGK